MGANTMGMRFVRTLLAGALAFGLVGFGPAFAFGEEAAEGSVAAEAEAGSAQPAADTAGEPELYSATVQPAVDSTVEPELDSTERPTATEQPTLDATDESDSSTVPRKNVWGGVVWWVEDKLLSIGPAHQPEAGYESGQLPSESAPWTQNEVNYYVREVRVLPGVFAKGSLAHLFYQMYGMRSCDLSGLDTSQATSLEGMFQGCDSLKQLDLSSFDTAMVTDMSKMFRYCTALVTVDLSGFDTANTKEAHEFFFNCTSLASVKVGQKFNFAGYGASGQERISLFANQAYSQPDPVDGMEHLYSGKWYLAELGDNAPRLDDSEIPSTLAQAGLPEGAGTWTAEEVRHYFGDGLEWDVAFNALRIYPARKGETGTMPELSQWRDRPWDPNSFYVAEVYPGVKAGRSLSGMFKGCSKLVFVWMGHLDASATTDFSSMFSGCTNLNPFDESWWFSAPAAEDLSYMFSGCKSLESVKSFPLLEGASPVKINGMFSGCSKLKSVDLSSLNTSRATDMSSLFASCSELESVNLSGLDTGGVKYMESMFYLCYRLKSLDLSSFETLNVTNMAFMFTQCFDLASLKLPATFDTSQVRGMAKMFFECRSLTSLELPDAFDTSRVDDMWEMFEGCKSLTSLELPDAFRTSKVRRMEGMFARCSKLTTLDLSNFDTSRVTNMDAMFSWCTSLSNLVLPDNFIGPKVRKASQMFCECRKLVELPANLSIPDSLPASGRGGMFWLYYAQDMATYYAGSDPGVLGYNFAADRRVLVRDGWLGGDGLDGGVGDAGGLGDGTGVAGAGGVTGAGGGGGTSAHATRLAATGDAVSATAPLSLAAAAGAAAIVALAGLRRRQNHHG